MLSGRKNVATYSWMLKGVEGMAVVSMGISIKEATSYGRDTPHSWSLIQLIYLE